MIVMISGRAGEGKTTFASFCKKFLEKNYYNVDIFSFASGVKETAKFMGWNGDKDELGRRLLQSIGNSGREYNKDIWANWNIRNITEWLYDIDKESWVALIDDWRFPNEGNILSEAFHPVLKLRIIRPKIYHTLWNTPLYNDISEASLPDAPDSKNLYDILIYNSTTLDELENTAKQFVERAIIGEKRNA